MFLICLCLSFVSVLTSQHTGIGVTYGLVTYWLLVGCGGGLSAGTEKHRCQKEGPGTQR